jgi:uncharacterized phage protein (TIGR01671 family)
MRNIKFRGKRKDNGEWVTGYLCENVFDKLMIQVVTITQLQRLHDTFEIIPETVGQFTGLMDKNGKELYESDIVLWDGFKAIIEWLPRMAGYYAMWKGEGVHFHDMQQIVPAHGGLRHIEIIGNIHDNSDLLNPPQEGVLNMNTDPGTKQADQEAAGAAEEAKAENTANEQAEGTQESAEEGNTEG